MIRSSFVSIYFASDKILIVKLNSSRNKVELFATVDLPKGVMQDHEVKDEKILADILRRIWLKLKIKERSVGIVIPEYSTYTKSLDLPKLEAEEIDEAVRWQAEEYIPLDPEEMILDWKIIRQTDEEYKVLAVAVKEKILKGYVNSTDQAGLFPLLVETPSISLARAAGADPAYKIVVYFSVDEIVTILSQGEEILASSVISIDSTPAALIININRILRNFGEISNLKIFVGGVPPSQGYITEISNNFKVTAGRLSYKLGGINETDLPKYIIPISLQFQDPLEPSSSDTVNLLPPEIISKYKGKRFNTRIWELMLIVTFIIVGCLMALTGTYLYMLQSLAEYKNSNVLTDVSYQRSKTASDEIKNVNTLSERTIRIDSVSFFPQEIMNLIYQKKPEGVAITSYKLDLEKGSVSIRGLAAGREDLLEFKNNLGEGGDFQNISLPLTSFEQGENIEFSLTFLYSKLVNPTRSK